MAAWRRLNEFKSDIQNEKKNIDLEVLRVESHIAKLKESKQWLTDISIKIKTININTDYVESNRIVKEFKGYLRKKIGLAEIEKEERKTQKNAFKRQDDADKD